MTGAVAVDTGHRSFIHQATQLTGTDAYTSYIFSQKRAEKTRI
jgi:hypothetical protein